MIFIIFSKRDMITIYRSCVISLSSGSASLVGARCLYTLRMNDGERRSAPAALFVCGSGSRRCRGRTQDVRRNFSTLQRCLWSRSAGGVSPAGAPAPALNTATLIPDQTSHDRARTRRDAIFQLIRPSIFDVEPHDA